VPTGGSGSFAKHGVTDIAASIQDDGAGPFICGIRLHWQFKDEACGVLARHSSRNYEEVRASSSGVWEIALPGDALQNPGMNARARRALWSQALTPRHAHSGLRYRRGELRQREADQCEALPITNILADNRLSAIECAALSEEYDSVSGLGEDHVLPSLYLSKVT
jgi:hypothetical protein